MTEVLYRKYRPQSWDEVYGQDHIVEVLRRSLELKKVGHAYLFSGSRGTGKTSIARIFAKELGCSETDIIEIDAASNRGIDDIRALKEGVQSLPFESERKMYIIDEVHMLTKEAFNALLKTLEEPPSHVVFVLATTEPQKVLPTIISRCQHFIFKSPNHETLERMINTVAEKEGMGFDAGVLDMIVFLANGSFRDAQGVLQKLLSYSQDKHISSEEAKELLGLPPQKLLHSFLSALAEGESDKLLSLTKDAASENIEAHLFLKLLVEKIRMILRMRFAPSILKKIEGSGGSSDDISFLIELAKSAKGINSTLLAQLLAVYAEMEYAYDKYIPLELAIFRLFGNNR